MIREQYRSSPSGSSLSRRLSLVGLFAATSTAALLACSDGDDEQVEALPLEPIVVPERPAPAAPSTPAVNDALPPGSDALNGVSVPTNLADWRVIGVVNVQDADGKSVTLRAVLGNDTAVDAARAGETNPWPEGSMIGHLQWTSGSEPASGTAVTPGDFAAATVMIKDTGDYGADGGWAYGVWRGTDLVPLPDPNFDQACINCHTSLVKDQDYVFTDAAELPSQQAIAAAPTLSNGLELPTDIVDWRVIGVASREQDANPSIRLIVGNDIAVDAARAGDTNPWPDGAMLAHYVWVPGENPDIDNAVTPVAFSQFTLMVKNAGEYAEDGGWAYGAWSSLDLTAPDTANFDQACVDCHTQRVSDTDFVFTRPGALPALLTDDPR
jgi:cytochrome P460